MTCVDRLARQGVWTVVVWLATALMPGLVAPVAAQYHQQNLVSDIPHLAPKTNPNVVNPWGITSSSSGPLWIADNGTGVATAFTGSGTPFPNPHAPLVVTIPPPMGSPAGTTAAPTGVVFNESSDFVVSEARRSALAMFIFATEDGTISGWNANVAPTQAILAIDNSANAVDGFHLTGLTGAVYKGLALGSTSAGTFLYTTNFRNGVVEMYDATFAFVRAFTDPTITPDASTPGFAPFGIRNINGQLYVTFAMQDMARHDDVKGPGHGFIDVFDLSGTLIQRFPSSGSLNSPWGLALAPANFGPLSQDLLVGNFGDGQIHAFDPSTGAFLGTLQDEHGQPITIDGLWGLTFGNGAFAGDTNVLFFTAGINEESDGLFGRIEAQNSSAD
jgi:uncharacterized protein (TIGR03118 family)